MTYTIFKACTVFKTYLAFMLILKNLQFFSSLCKQYNFKQLDYNIDNDRNSKRFFMIIALQNCYLLIYYKPVIYKYFAKLLSLSTFAKLFFLSIVQSFHLRAKYKKRPTRKMQDNAFQHGIKKRFLAEYKITSSAIWLFHIDVSFWKVYSFLERKSLVLKKVQAFILIDLQK